MSMITSSIKPTEEEVVKDTGRENVRKKPNIEWNDESYKSWVANGLIVSFLYTFTHDL